MDRGLGMTECASSQGVKPKAQGFCGERQACCTQWRVEGEGARALLPQTASAPGSCRSRDEDSQHSCF